MSYFILFTNYYWSDQINENEIGRACNMPGRDEKYIGIGERIILKWILRKLGGRISNGFIWLRMGTTGRLFCSRINIWLAD
jgi:hypothetical protein